MSRVLGVVASHADAAALTSLLENLTPTLQSYQAPDTRHLETHLGALRMFAVQERDLFALLYLWRLYLLPLVVQKREGWARREGEKGLARAWIVLHAIG